MNRADLKQKAKAQLGGKIFGNVWLYAVLVALVNGIVLALAGKVPVLGQAVYLLVVGPLGYATAKMYLKQSRDGQPMNIPELVDGFKDDFSGNFLLGLLSAIFIALWSILLVVPGIIKGLSWSMIYYVKAEHPDYGWKQCMDASAALTNGHKGEIFVLQLSFIGWYIVGSLCLGIGTLWVNAYYQAAMTQCYNWLKTQNVSAV